LRLQIRQGSQTLRTREPANPQNLENA
jgi:hypothetical protein